jgi:DNA-binding MarR family transcriptional regulator
MAEPTTTTRRARRSPTAEELRTWRAFIESTDTLRSAIAARFQEDGGLSEGDYSVLLALTEAGERTMRSSDLAAQVGWERSRLSHHLGRMERRQLIRREECATDNRGAEVTPTAVGVEIFRRASAPHMHAIRELFLDALTPAQLDAASELAGALQAHLAAIKRS